MPTYLALILQNALYFENQLPSQNGLSPTSKNSYSGRYTLLCIVHYFKSVKCNETFVCIVIQSFLLRWPLRSLCI